MTAVSGDTLDLQTGMAIKADSKVISPAEVGVLDGISAAEIALIDGVTAGTSTDGKVLSVGSTGLLNGGYPVVVYSDTAGVVTLAAGKTIFAGVTGITLTPIAVTISVVGDSIETATSIILATNATSPQTVATISGAALECASGQTVSAGATSATLVYGAGFGVAGTAGKGFTLTGASATTDTGYVRVTVVCMINQ